MTDRVGPFSKRISEEHFVKNNPTILPLIKALLPGRVCLKLDFFLSNHSCRTQITNRKTNQLHPGLFLFKVYHFFKGDKLDQQQIYA